MNYLHGNTTHGGRHTRLYGIWCNMKARCKGTGQESDKDFYSRKGITVCQEWKDSFEAFRDWALTNGYSDTLTIDRIDGTKGYSTDNCRWATPKEQANNTKRNVFLTWNNKTQTITQWSDELNIPYFTLIQRIKKLGWSAEKALTTPVNSRIRNL